MFEISNIKYQISKLRHVFTRPRVSYEPLIEVRISKEAILHNLKTYREAYPKFGFVPVLKSNAYGHGLVEVASILDKENAPFFMVDSFYEALVLRRAGIKTKILVLGYATLEQINKNNLKDVSFAIIDLEQLKNISANLIRKTFFHLKIDTGMHRQGMLPGQVMEAVKIIRSNSNFILEGVCSHFADADGKDQSFSKGQIKLWNEVSRDLQNLFSSIKFLHLSNTGGAFYLPEINANVGRLGIGLYGFNTSHFSNLNLKPALEMVSIVTSIKTISAGEKVGYNNLYTATRPTKIATVPVGYNEGLDRRLSDKGFVKINNSFCPIVGRISMNMCSIDVTEIKNIKLEDEVVVISRNSQDKNSVESISELTGQIPHEILVDVPGYLKRVVSG
ncbi:MAG: alanine racemase [Candidatus Doudnabacteria bacterium]|nr:alanine racemase [Candidatus Doudnabacteria bacterium]